MTLSAIPVRLTRGFRPGWVDVALPYSYADAGYPPWLRGPAGMAAMTGQVVGDHSIMVTVPVDPERHDRDIELVPVVTDSEIPTDPFRVDKTLDQPITVEITGLTESLRLELRPVDVEPSPRRLRIRYRASERGWHADLWVTYYHGDPVAEVAGSVIWSDRHDPRWTCTEAAGASIEWSFGAAYIYHDFGRSPLTTIGDRGTSDGACASILRGRISTDPARLGPPMAAVAVGIWDHPGRWLGMGVIPDSVEDPDGYPAGTHYDLLADRPLALSRTPGQSGDQRPFCATPGYHAVTAGDPDWLIAAAWSCEALGLRPYHYRYEDGSRIDPSRHPECQTWTQQPDWRNGSDTLGKAHGWPDRPANGWHCIDDQHYAMTLECAYVALTGCPLVLSWLEDCVSVDATQVRGRPGAARATGRLNLSWAHMLRLLPDATVDQLVRRVMDRIGEILPRATEVKAQQVFRDPRVLTADGHWTGKPVEAWQVWQESLLCIGLYAMHLATDIGDDTGTFVGLARDSAETIVLYGFSPDGSYLASGIRWGEGEPIPDDMYGEPGWTTDGSSFASWVLPSVKIATRLSDDPTVIAKAQGVMNLWRPHGARDPRDAEWLAV